MQIYLAPMEGITMDAYRRALNACFPGVTKYFTPFISATKNFNYKQTRDMEPANNPNMTLIPQFMATKAEDVLYMQALAKEQFGHVEINLNQGCPSGTVVSKNHGSGFLRVPEVMDAFLDDLFSKADFPISIKTRIGVEDANEWDKILSIYAKYPLSELIIHPRTTRDQYQGSIHMDAFELALKTLHVPVCYNGDIKSLADYIAIKERFPELDRIMIGRGILRNPMLLPAINAYEERGEREYMPSSADYQSLYRMMTMIRDDYVQSFSGEAHVLAHLKELWGYLQDLFPEEKKQIKTLKKSRKLAEYDAVVQLLFNRK